MFLDLRKAFDTLNHRIILSKLLRLNFSPHTLRWIESYLSGRTQYVSIQNYNSAPLSISTGVPQGSILGPLLFTLYINDLPSVCPNTKIQMYADDTVIYIHGSSVSQVANELTESLVHVAAWLEQCCLQLNISKTVCMFIAKTKNLSVVPDVFVSGERLQVVSEYKYLGVLIDSKLSFGHRLKRSVTGSDLVYQILDLFVIICHLTCSDIYAFHDYFSYYLLFNYLVARQYYYSETTRVFV